MKIQQSTVSILTLLVSLCSSISIIPTSDANTLANGLFSGPGVRVVAASFTGAAGAAGTFSDGPFGIGAGTILTSGLAINALPGGASTVQNFAPGPDIYCGNGGSNDASFLAVAIDIDSAFSGILVEIIVASAENGAVADTVGVFVDGVQYALDATNDRITVLSSYVRPPISIQQPNNGLSYTDASPPLSFGIPLSPGSHDVVLSMCDISDEILDSALMIKAEGCVDCNKPIGINYVTTSTTVSSDVEATSTSTIKASGTVAGTFLIVTATTADTTTVDTTTADTTTADATTADTTTADITTADTTTVDTTVADIVTATDTTTADTTVADIVAATDTTAADTTTGDPTTATGITTADSKSDTEITIADITTSGTTSDTETTTTTADPTNSSTTTVEDDETSTILNSRESTTTATDDLEETTSTSGTFITPDRQTSSSEILDLADPTTTTTDDLVTTTVSESQSTIAISQSYSTSSSTSLPPGTTTSDTTTNEIESPADTSSIDLTIETTSPTQQATETEGESSLTSTDFQLPGTLTSPSSIISLPSTTAFSQAENLPIIGRHLFRGCLGSLEGYPTFTELSTDPDMTTEKCIALASESKYIGIYQRSCYVAESLSDTEFVPDGTCNLLCPGDETLYCGGRIDKALPRRAIDANRLLTLYALDDVTSSETSIEITQTGTLSSMSSPIRSDQFSSSEPAITDLETSATLVSEPDAIYEPTSVDEETSQVRFPIPFPTAGPITSMRWTTGLNYTRTMRAETITTVTYVTIDSNNPEILVTTHIPVTLGYTPCHCDHQLYPPVAMTTILSPCNACGTNGENHITLTVPKAACETGRTSHPTSQEKPFSPHGIKSPFYPHRIEGHRVYHTDDKQNEVQPTQGRQGHSFPSEDVKHASAPTRGSVEVIDKENVKPTQAVAHRPVISVARPNAQVSVASEPSQPSSIVAIPEIPSGVRATESTVVHGDQTEVTSEVYHGRPVAIPDEPVVVAQASRCYPGLLIVVGIVVVWWL